MEYGLIQINSITDFKDLISFNQAKVGAVVQQHYGWQALTNMIQFTYLDLIFMEKPTTKDSVQR